MEIFWFIPTHGDGRYLGTSRGGRETDLLYLRQIAQAVDQLGFRGAPLAHGPLVRGRLGRRLGAHAVHSADAVSRGSSARTDVAGSRRAGWRPPSIAFRVGGLW